ncbi:unnamed protein product [Brugia pahangi]|uniref:Tudor domain-containing protein n=1 Tax=Brugia pahangi TaxID=6280 RepID=A0A158PSS6_BRUPA|nr:unnamed protein product [Brugia pahangi]
MENNCMDGRLSQLIESIDDKIRAIALNANVSYEDLRNGYVMSCLHITKPFEYNISNLKAKQKIISEMVTRTEKYEDKTIEQPAVDDNITMQDEKSDNQLRTYQNIPISNKKVHTKKQQRNEFDYKFGYGNSSKRKSFMRQRNQQNFCFRSVRGSNVLPPVISAPNNTTNRVRPYKMNDNEPNGNNGSLQPKDSNNKKVTKFICDIEAALEGEISDMEDERGQVSTDNNKFNKLSNDDAEETIKKVQEETNRNHLEARIVRYPNGQSLALNIIHKVYVVHLEDTYAWVRLSDDIEPPCFDHVYAVMKETQSLQWEELLPGTPCVVLARFSSRDIVNGGTVREVTKFESYARAIIEERHNTSKTVTVRLVDFGFRLTQLSVTTIKPLTIAFDGPPLAFRLLINSLPKQQKETLCRYATLRVRLTVSHEKQFLCWSKTWKAIDIRKENWINCSSSTKSFEMCSLNDQQQCDSNECLSQLTRDPATIENDQPKSIKKDHMEVLKKESEKKEKKWQAIKVNSNGCNYRENSNHRGNSNYRQKSNHRGNPNRHKNSDHWMDSIHREKSDHRRNSNYRKNSNYYGNSSGCENSNHRGNSNHIKSFNHRSEF